MGDLPPSARRWCQSYHSAILSSCSQMDGEKLLTCLEPNVSFKWKLDDWCLEFSFKDILSKFCACKYIEKHLLSTSNHLTDSRLQT